MLFWKTRTKNNQFIILLNPKSAQNNIGKPHRHIQMWLYLEVQVLEFNELLLLLQRQVV